MVPISARAPFLQFCHELGFELLKRGQHNSNIFVCCLECREEFQLRDSFKECTVNVDQDFTLKFLREHDDDFVATISMHLQFFHYSDDCLAKSDCGST